MNATPGAWLLGAGWGLVLAVPFVRGARRLVVSTRAAELATEPRLAPGPARILGHAAVFLRMHRDGPLVRVVRSFAPRREVRRGNRLLARELPVAIDLLGVAVGAGCTPYLAVDVAARWSPRPLDHIFREVLRRCSLGLDFEGSLDAAAREAPLVQPLADALLASDRLGVPVGPVLARLAEEDRTSLRRAAEAHARRIPVRLLFPLVFLVLPAFVLLTVVPGLAAGLGRL